MIEHHTAKLLAHNADKLPEHQNAGALMMTKATPVVESISRKPNHRAHFTRNIAVGILLGEHFRIVKIVKIHMDLMTRYNGRKIILP